MTPAALNALLCRKAEAVCKELLPNGRRVGSDWCVADIGGEKGDSLKICMYGEKAGLWCDFASTGEEHGGDMLDLWRMVRGLSFTAMLDEVRSWLGVHEETRDSQPDRHYARPDRPAGFLPIARVPDALTYLLGRGLTADTLLLFKIAATPEELAFPSITPEGELVNIKYLKLARPDGKKIIRQEKNAEPTLFGWHALNDSARFVVITEGQIDAMTVHQWGFPALSIPNGASPGHGQDWIEVDYDRLLRFDTIYLCTDMDKPGRDILPELIRRLGPNRCRVIDLPSPNKDANDALMAGMTSAQFNVILASAKSHDPAELKSASEYGDAIKQLLRPAEGTDAGVDTPFPKLSGGKLRFRPGEVSLWAGFSGSGKSNLLGYIAINSMAAGHRWCIASMEMLPAKTLLRMTRQHYGLARPSDDVIDEHTVFVSDKLWLFAPGEKGVGVARLDRVLEVFDYAARRYGVTQFVVDSLTKFNLKEDDYSGHKDIVNALVAFAHRHNAHVHLVAHVRKLENEDYPPRKLDVRGGAALTDLVDNVIIVWANKRLSKGPFDEDGLIIVDKQRDDDGYKGAVRLWFDRRSLRYADSINAFAPPEKDDSCEF